MSIDYMEAPWMDREERRQENGERQDKAIAERKRIRAGLYDDAGPVKDALPQFNPAMTREHWCAGFECMHVLERFAEPVPIASLKRRYCHRCLMFFIREAKWERYGKHLPSMPADV